MMYQGGFVNGGVDWEYFNKFKEINNKYLPDRDEGETKASQVVTAVNKLIYKWYNDGDVFDNHYFLAGWWNDLSSYANWLYENTNNRIKLILNRIEFADSHAKYEQLLQMLADECLNSEFLEELEKVEKTGTIYHCDGKFSFEDYDQDEEY